MTFNSLQYALFLPVVLAGYWLLPGRGDRPGIAAHARQLWLLAASYLFYALFDWRFSLLLLFTTVVDYNVAKGLERVEHRRRLLLACSIAVNLGVLGAFKYFNFFVDSAAELLTKVGLDASVPVLRVALPYGISFYTFQSIGYTVDVYRRQIAACRDPIDFATFVAFFPQLVAGPISRAKNLLPQIQTDRRPPKSRQVLSGCLLILLGLFKKVVLADPLAPVVAKAFGGASDAGTGLAAIGVLAFAIQIYADFSGYTDMARGSARLLNIELVHNFDQPYLSRNITEFWRRWHISLSTWLRDYVYIPLGGNRGGTVAALRNLMITMLLGGLWHGAGWNFIVWGGLHGTYLCVDRLRGARRDLPDGVPRAREVPSILITFVLVCVAWVFFRSGSFDQALEVLRAFVRPTGIAPSMTDVALVGSAAVLVLGIDLAQRAITHPLTAIVRRPARTGVLAGAAVVAIVVFSGGAPVPFIYFQF
jgi:D-alanyl-lipoteichoic acid acyltransferase DltB (MBOAT superfamily)